MRSAVRPLAPVDAQMAWMGRRMPNDQFLLYGFDGAPTDLTATIETVLQRARGSADLAVRLVDRGPLRYPAWAPAHVGRDRTLVHHLADATWAGCLDAVVALTSVPLGATPWRLHVFADVVGIPGVTGAGTVAVVQISHALGDGTRSAALAATLFGRPGVPPRPTYPPRYPFALPIRAARASRDHRQLVRDEAAGRLPPPAASCPVLRTNGPPTGARVIRTLTRRRADVGPGTVTVAVLTAVSEALAGHLRDLGDDPSHLTAEVPMAKRGPRLANNHFGNVGVALHPDVPRAERAALIAAQLAERRRRADHPAHRSAAIATASVPAGLLRWGISRFDLDARSATATGNTVVSSVYRGPADLEFGGASVTVTSSFPQLSPMMALAHGVHGIGDTVAVSVHAAESALGGADGVAAYVDRLTAAL